MESLPGMTADKAVKQITNDWADYGSVSLANNGNKILATRASMSHPTDIYMVTPGKNAKTTKVEQITRENDHILNQLTNHICLLACLDW